MSRGLRISRMFGISIYADWIWILVLLIITWELGGAVFPELDPQWDSALAWAAAFAASVLFFVSVLVHELAHSLMAKANRITIREITLFPFGGIPNVPRESTSPADEMLMAIVGPATSLLLGGVLLWCGLGRAGTVDPIASGIPPTLVGLDPLAMLLLWLGTSNLLLGALNLMPGFPMDGGRVLHSILWQTTRDWRRATRWASGTGQLVAWGLAAAGVLIVLSAQPSFSGVAFLGGFWLCFCGWVMNRAIQQIDRQVALQDLLAVVPIAQFMSARVPTVPPNIPLSSLMNNYAMGSNSAGFPVVDNDHLVGLICTQDVRKVPHEKWDTTEVGEVMTSASRLAIARPDRAGRDALGIWAQAWEMPADVASYSVGQENG